MQRHGQHTIITANGLAANFAASIHCRIISLLYILWVSDEKIFSLCVVTFFHSETLELRALLGARKRDNSVNYLVFFNCDGFMERSQENSFSIVYC